MFAAAAAAADATKPYLGLSKTWQKLLPFVVVFFLLSIFVFQSHVVTNGIRQPASTVQSRLWESGRDVEASIQDAGNSTLGFSSIVALNLKARYDRLDAMILQGYLSNLDITLYPGVEKTDISATGSPPTSNPSRLSVGERACWRAHANVWAKVLQERLPPVLILEGDATWDVNIRTIMPQFNRQLRKLLQKVNSTALHDPRWAPDHGPTPNNTDDPWMSSHWDMISFGNCISEVISGENDSVAYHDPYAAQVGEEPSPGGRRLVYRTGTISCLTSYAISQTGAAKLLLRTVTNLDEPVDIIMGDMVQTGELVVYHMEPPLMAQWMYVGGIGKGSAASDIHAEEIKGQDSDLKKEAWAEVEETRNVWHYWYLHSHPWRFNGSALRVAGNRILGKKVPLG